MNDDVTPEGPLQFSLLWTGYAPPPLQIDAAENLVTPRVWQVYGSEYGRRLLEVLAAHRQNGCSDC